MSHFLSFTIRDSLQNHTSYFTCTVCPTSQNKMPKETCKLFHEESIALKNSLCYFIPFYCGNLRVF